jgi:hypothetical protein
MSTVTIIILIGILFYLGTCVALIDIAQKDFGGLEKKVLWGFIAFIPFAGCLIYFAFGCRRGKKPGRMNPDPK